ncbi:prepilin-type N-terminal cleavage/methylation domain-containing protein [Bdellovibrio bacteriovorus]|uniref:prepilin-type N-terminal cleavage/methylation domain-containing protein n=1 Tax=Bdellovibrio bacteriovorus TaxID=959 RepID=UPI0021D184C0|nr:prepilin-type N-terminal cleavage/methylation domain-containing protein [Bdellovibrio bacteriovorus]UXR66162.1 prepilin-type N-terminal cleavage/methylation domain-containing protein [Bdellovibrio bacteriovorus]
MMKNQRGFTLAEMIVGVALMGIMGMVAASFFVFTAKTKTEITNEIEDKVDSILAERLILRDLKGSEPSFNNLNVLDDYGRRFFDYVSDASESAIDNSERMLTLEAGRRHEFIFISVAERKGGTILYTPASAYEVGNPPADPRQAASLNFVSLNRNNEVTFANDKIWIGGNVVMLDTPTTVREMTPTGPNYTKPARSPIFLGVVANSGASTLARINLANLIDMSNPMYPNETITNEDKFLRDIPPMGGAAPLVRLKVVNIIKYYLAKDQSGKQINLWRSIYGLQGFTQPQLFAYDVQKVEFSRKDAKDSLIYFKIVRPEKK